MILKVQRTIYTGKKEEYSIFDKSDILIQKCNLDKIDNNMKFNLNYNDEKIELNIPENYSEHSTIVKNNNEIGKIENGSYETKVSTDYYWNMNYGNMNFKLYEIGFGSKGLYLVIKEGEKTVAIISSVMVVKDFKDSYELFVEDDKYSIVSILACIYWNLYRGTSFVKEGISGVGTINKVLNTISKEIIDKMDYEFIDKISKEENYVVNNQNKKSMVYQIIGWSLFIMFIIFLILMLVLK